MFIAPEVRQRSIFYYYFSMFSLPAKEAIIFIFKHPVRNYIQSSAVTCKLNFNLSGIASEIETKGSPLLEYLI